MGMGVMGTTSSDDFDVCGLWGFHAAMGWFMGFMGNSRIADKVHGGYGNLSSDGLIYRDYRKFPQRGFICIGLKETASSDGLDVCGL